MTYPNDKLSSIVHCALLAALATAANAQDPIAPPAGLLGFWAMDGNADDFGPLAMHGAVAGAGGSFVAGEVGLGFQPAAGSGCIAIPDAPELDVRNHFTFEGWLRLDALSSGLGYLVNKGTTVHRSTPYAFGVIGSNGALPTSNGASVTGTRGPGRLFVSVSDGSLEQVIIANTALPLGTFVHVAFELLPVGTGTQCRIFLNGASVGFATIGRFPFAGAQSLQLAGTTGGGAILGVFDECTLYDRGLTAAELQAIVAAGPQGKQKPNFDVTPPQVSILQPANGSVVADRMVAVQARVVDDSATEVQSTPAGVAQSLPIGGGVATGVVMLDAQDGEQTIAVSALDSGSNTGADSVTVTLDSTPPLAMVLSPLQGAVLSSTPSQFAVQVDDLTATTVQVAGQSRALPPGLSTVAFALDLIEGPNELSFLITDAAGNQTTVVRDVVLDLGAPLVAIAEPADGALFGASQQDVAVTARVDDLTATSVMSTPGGLQGSLPPGGGLVSGIVPLQEGLNQIRVHASDSSGRGSDAVVTVNRDGTAPMPQFVAPAADSLVRGSIEIVAEASDVAPGSGIARLEVFDGSVLLQGGAGTSLRFDLDTRTLADGEHLLRLLAADGAGNQAEVPLRLSVDNTAPQLRVLQPLASSTVQGIVAFVASADDNGSGIRSLVQRVAGRAPSQDGSQQFELPVASAMAEGSEDTAQSPNGPLQFEVEATDAAGNVAVLVVDVEVQNLVADGGAELCPAEGARVRGRIDIRVRSDRRDVAQIELFVDDRRIATGQQAQLNARFDTATRLDGPMHIRALVHTLHAGILVTEHTVHVDNLRVLWVAPQQLSLRSGGGHAASVLVAGRSAGLLLPLRSHRLELRVPGGAAVPIQSAGSLWRGCGDDRLLALGFDRQRLVDVLLAARATGAVPASAAVVRLRLFVDDVDVGSARIRIEAERRGCGRRR